MHVASPGRGRDDIVTGIYMYSGNDDDNATISMIDRQPSDIGLDELDTNVRAYGYFVGYLGCSKMQVCREPPGGGRDGNPHKGRKYGSDIDDRGTT